MLTVLSSLDRSVAERSLLIKNMLEDLGDNVVSQIIPIPNVSPILAAAMLQEIPPFENS